MSDHTMCPGCHQLRYWTDFDARCSQCRQPTPSSGEETESSPQCRCSMLSWSPLCERHGWLALIRRIQALEAGPQSPPTTAKDTRADRWGVVTESTNQTTPPSSPSGRSTTPTCLVEPGCACALLSHKPPTTLWQSMQIQGKWERVLRVGCPHCDALWAFVQIVARPVPASPSGST